MAKNKSTPKDDQNFKKFNSSKFKGNVTQRFKDNKLKKNTNKERDNKRNNSSKGDNGKINYCLNPKMLQKKIKDVKESERKEKEKSFQLKKRKRNAIYMRTTDKGQPKLNARMKILYDQIARSCEKT